MKSNCSWWCCDVNAAHELCHHHASGCVVAPDVVLNCPQAAELAMVRHYDGALRPHLPGLHSVIAPVRSATGQLACHHRSHMHTSGMWSWLRRLGLETISRRTDVSSRSRLYNASASRFRLSLGAIYLSLDPVGLISGLGPLCLVKMFCAGVHCAYCRCS